LCSNRWRNTAGSCWTNRLSTPMHRKPRGLWRNWWFAIQLI